MVSGSLVYGSHIEGIEFDNIEIPSAEPNVQKVEVASDKGGNVSINVHVENVASQEEAEALGLREATRAVNILAFEQGKYVRDPVCKGHALMDGSTGIHMVGNSVSVSAHAFCVKKLGGHSLAVLKSALEDPTPAGEADYPLFRSSLNTRDVASKFLSLYRLLGRLADPTGKDRQCMIDPLIKKHEPGVDEPNSPWTGQPETVYTKLRNEHMHRSGKPLTQVRADMETHLPGLTLVLQKAIKNP